MNPGGRLLRAVIAAGLVASPAACDLLSPTPKRPAPLAAGAQQAAAERLAVAFAGACLSEPDPAAAARALRARGWPGFNTVWREPASVFYAAPPSPAGLFVIGDKPWGKGAGAQRITCVGHYPAETAAPMVAAIAKRWGPGRDGVGPYPGAQVWAFTAKAGVLTPLASTRGLSSAEAARLEPDEAHVFVQVFYNRPLGDVASLIAVSRRVGRYDLAPRPIQETANFGSSTRQSLNRSGTIAMLGP